MQPNITDTSSPATILFKREEELSVIELPYNITDIIRDGGLLVDVTVSGNAVELLTSELAFEFNAGGMNWTDAEAYCVAKGTPHEKKNVFFRALPKLPLPRPLPLFRATCTSFLDVKNNVLRI